MTTTSAPVQLRLGGEPEEKLQSHVDRGEFF
jgi:hypothetical protein